MHLEAFMPAWLKAFAPARLVLITIVGARSVLAQGLDPLDACNGKNNAAADARIEGCSAVIKTGKYRASNAAPLYYNRGNAYGEKGDYDTAIADYDQAIKLNQNYAAALNNRGLANASKSNYAAAIADFGTAIGLEPKNASRYYNRAGVYVDRAVASDPDQAVKDYGEAIKDYNQAIELDPNSASAYNNRGVAYANRGEQGDIDLAVKDYTDAVRLEPGNATHLYNLGLAKREKGDVAGGNADIDKARGIQSDISEKFTRFGMK
jgi:tetratricopeptide (TPR) repeat protein